MNTNNSQTGNEQKILEMEVLIYAPLSQGGFDDEPMECTVTGKDESTTVEDLKNDLDEVVIATLKRNSYGSSDYLVEIRFEKGGEYVDQDGPCRCFCDMENETVEWKFDDDVKSLPKNVRALYIAGLDEWAPCDGGEHHEDRVFQWFCVTNQSELDVLNDYFGTEREIGNFPEYICMEQSSGWAESPDTATFSICKNYVVSFFEAFGYDVTIERRKNG